MRRLLSTLFFLLLLGLAVYFLWPVVKNAQQYAALLNAAPPSARSLPNPLPGTALTDTWGAARSGGRTHEGIDIFAKRDTPIQSTTRGIVLNLGENSLGGRTVTILGPGGWRHYYAHLERYPDLNRGDWVQAGDVVGYVGNSGNARGTPPHLHYGIYTGSGATNPYPLMRRE